MTKALISIDYTVDFVADNGKLTAGALAQAISETIAQVTEAAFKRTLESFGWTSAIILPFLVQIWIYVCEKEK